MEPKTCYYQVEHFKTKMEKIPTINFPEKFARIFVSKHKPEDNLMHFKRRNLGVSIWGVFSRIG